MTARQMSLYFVRLGTALAVCGLMILSGASGAWPLGGYLIVWIGTYPVMLVATHKEAL